MTFKMIQMALFICVIFASVAASGDCRNARRICVKSCFGVVTINESSQIPSPRTDLWVQCEAACLEGIKYCSVYEPPTAAKCGDFQALCKRSCPTNVYVYANMQGIQAGYYERSDAPAVCERACEAGYNSCH